MSPLLIALICGAIAGVLNVLSLALGGSSHDRAPRAWMDYVKVFLTSTVVTGLLVWLALAGYLAFGGAGAIASHRGGSARSPMKGPDVSGFEVVGELPNF